MKINITLTAGNVHEKDLTGKIAVVIDVLRATSVMATALSNGARWVKAVESIDEANRLRSNDVLLGGERHAHPIDGFDFSNSPLEYTPQRVHDKGIILTTTNGTLAISKCGRADEVIAGSFLNASGLTKHLILANKPVELICAGTNGEFSLDDFLCAGLICKSLKESGVLEGNDLIRLAIKTWKEASADIHAALAESYHYNVLKSKGFIPDLEYCLQKDLLNCVPIKTRGNDHFT